MKQFKTFIDIHKAYLAKEEYKVWNHPTYKTWAEFQKIIDYSKHITIKRQYLLYIYYLMQKYCTTEIACRSVNLFFNDNKGFSTHKNGSVSVVLRSSLNKIIICSDNEEYSFTKKGKEYIRSLLICE